MHNSVLGIDLGKNSCSIVGLMRERWLALDEQIAVLMPSLLNTHSQMSAQGGC